MNDITVPKTKTQTKKMLVEERKKMRQQAKQSKFMQKTLNVFNGMVLRLSKLRLPEPTFTLAEFRQWIVPRLTICHHCGSKLTSSNWTVDHETPVARGGATDFDNLVVCCKPCNFQKGILTGYEFRCLIHDFLSTIPAEAATDVKRRLTIGGKWSFGK